LLADQGATDDELSLFDPTLRYVSRPQFPPTALSDATAQPFEAGEAGPLKVSFDASGGITGVGTTDLDVLLLIPNLRNDVCRRINVSANNLLPSAPPLEAAGENGTREGCFAESEDGAGTYFRVVATDVAPAGA
jgi:hypothetical protein